MLDYRSVMCKPDLVENTTQLSHQSFYEHLSELAMCFSVRIKLILVVLFS